MKVGDIMAAKTVLTKEVAATPVVEPAKTKAVKAEAVKAEKTVKTEAVKAETVKKDDKKADLTAKKQTADKKQTAKKASVKKTGEEKTCNFYIQYDGKQFDYEEIVARSKEAAAADMGKKVTSVKTIDIYCKPQDNAAYYVANGKVAGRIDL